MHSMDKGKEPKVSPYMVDLTQNLDISGAARYPLVKAHGESNFICGVELIPSSLYVFAARLAVGLVISWSFKSSHKYLYIFSYRKSYKIFKKYGELSKKYFNSYCLTCKLYPVMGSTIL